MDMNDTEETLLGLFKEGITEEKEIDEAMLRYFVYGSTDEVENCDLIQSVLEKKAFKKTFPVKFVTASIEHIIHCNSCFKYYSSIASDSLRSTIGGHPDELKPSDADPGSGLGRGEASGSPTTNIKRGHNHE